MDGAYCGSGSQNSASSMRASTKSISSRLRVAESSSAGCSHFSGNSSQKWSTWTRTLCRSASNSSLHAAQSRPKSRKAWSFQKSGMLG